MDQGVINCFEILQIIGDGKAGQLVDLLWNDPFPNQNGIVLGMHEKLHSAEKPDTKYCQRVKISDAQIQKQLASTPNKLSHPIKKTSESCWDKKMLTNLQ